MDEAWWLSCTDPAAMLRLVTENPDHANINCISERKLRLFACACCRAVWHLLTDDRSRRAVEVAERFADGLATSKERGLAMNMADNIPHGCNVGDGLLQERSRVYACLRAHAVQGAMEAARLPTLRDRDWGSVQAALLRDIIGNPFRPVVLKWVCANGEVYNKCPNGNRLTSDHEISDDGKQCLACGAHRTIQGVRSKVRQIAQTIYDVCDFAVLGVLADALEDVEADNADLLTHLRSPGPHVRGCWALDCVLGFQ